MNVEVQVSDSESKEWLLKFVALEKGLPEVEDPDAFEVCLYEEKKSQWLEKTLHGGFLKYGHRENRTMVEGRTSWERDWANGAAQEQVLWLNSIKHLIDDQDPSTMCRLCGKLSEMVMHLSGGCPVI